MKNLMGKLRLALLAPVLFGLMAGLLVVAVVAMEVRNLARWVNLWAEFIVGDDTLYRDLWPMTVGALWDTYRNSLKRG